MYEAAAVNRALREGRLEAEEWTHAESVTTQRIVDQLRSSVVRAGGGKREARGRWWDLWTWGWRARREGATE